MDISDYEVTIDRSAMGFWVWHAKDPQGNPVQPRLGLIARGAFMGKTACEKDALDAIRFHAREADTMSGAELEQRVAGRQIHHKDGDRANNDPDNLELRPT